MHCRIRGRELGTGRSRSPYRQPARSFACLVVLTGLILTPGGSAAHAASPPVPDVAGVFHACVGPKAGPGSGGTAFYPLSLFDPTTVKPGVAPCGTGRFVATWNQRGINWKGAWLSSASYTKNDAVGYNGASWIALAPGANRPPSAASTFWALLAQKGEKGAPGGNNDATTTTTGNVLIDVAPSTSHPIALTRDSSLPAGNLTGTVGAGRGGTGLTSAGAAGNLLRSDGATWTSSPLQVSDIPDLSSRYVRSTTTPQGGVNLLVNSARILQSDGHYGNLFLGGGAGQKNDAVGGGAFNTALGANALSGNTTGNDNTATGSNTMQYNTTGFDNTASGFNALQSNGTGYSNTAVGSKTLGNNTSGYENTATGYDSLQNNDIGYHNTATGTRAMRDNFGGHDNTASGYEALLQNDYGIENTAAGASALGANTSGSDNTASGYQVLLSNDTGYQNTVSGSLAMQKNRGGYANTASGYYALHENLSGYENVASGYLALWSNTSGRDNVAIGNRALQTNVTGYNNTAIGSFADVVADGVTNSTAIGAGAMVGESNAVVLGNGGVRVGIGTSTPGYTLDVHGTGHFSQAVSCDLGCNNTSDRHVKTDIHPIDVQAILQRIESLPISTWRYKADLHVKHVGPMAQDFYKAFGLGGDNKHIATVDSEGLALAAIKALAKLDHQQAGQIATQERQIRSLAQQLNRLEQRQVH